MTNLATRQVVGVIHSHAAIRKATYTNVAIYDVLNARGIHAAIDVDLKGSAVQYGIDASSPLYAFRFARKCGSTPFCYSVPTTFPGCGTNCKLTVAERAYLNPETLVGPDPHELLAPVLLEFRARP